MYTASAVEVDSILPFFKALADDTRLRIVALLSHGELCVCHFETALKLSQPNVSRQLAVLREAEVVESRREGTWIYYRLTHADTERGRLLREIAKAFAHQQVLKRDVARLKKNKGPNLCR